MSELPSSRCGYTWPTDHEVDDPPFHQGCCWRKSVNDSDYCIWHTNPEVESKSVEALQEARVPPEIRKKTSPYSELLYGANISNLVIKDEISLKRVALNQSDLSGTRLNDINLSEADLRGADISESNLAGANLSESNLEEADLSDTDLPDADLSKANLRYTNFSNTNLHGADLRAIFEEANLSDAEIAFADLSGGGLISVDLSEARLHSADLSDTTIHDANFSKADISHADLSEADITDSDFSYARLNNADLLGTTLTETNLHHVDAEGVDFTGADLAESSFSGADCESADFKDAVLVQASLENANLVNTNLTGSYLFGTRLEGARINSTTQLTATGSIGELTVSERCRYDIDAPPDTPEASVAMEANELKNSPDSPRVIQLRRARSTYRRLEKLAQQNGFSVLQSRMFKRRQEMRRHLLHEQGERTRWLFAELQRWLFVYGESFRRVLSVSALTISLFWILFTITGTLETTDGIIVTASSVSEEPLLAWETLYFTISVFFAGSGSLSPTGTFGQILTASLRAVGPILLALLIFVLGRRAAK